MTTSAGWTPPPPLDGAPDGPGGGATWPGAAELFTPARSEPGATLTSPTVGTPATGPAWSEAPPSAGWAAHDLDPGGRQPLPTLLAPGQAARPRWSDRLGSGRRRALRLAVARYRRLLVAACLALAAGLTVQALTPAEPETEPVPVAARDLPAGHRLTAGDLTPARWPVGTAPRGLVSVGAGRTLAAPMRAGEPLTDVRLVGPGLLAGQPAGTLAVPVRLADAVAAAQVRAGDRVDVLAAAGDGFGAPAGAAGTDGLDGVGGTGEVGGTTAGSTDGLAVDALVLAAPGAGGVVAEGDGAFGALTGGPTDETGGGLLWLAVDGESAARLGAAAGRTALTVALRGAP